MDAAGKLDLLVELGVLGARRALEGLGQGPDVPAGCSRMTVGPDDLVGDWFVGVVERTTGVREFWSWLGGERYVVVLP